MPFKHTATHSIFLKNFHSICTVRSCKPRCGAFNKGGSESDDRQILLLDLGSNFHGDSLCSGACFEPALTLWFCWSHLCQMWVWKLWASRIPDHCPPGPVLGCSFGASVLPSLAEHGSCKAVWKHSICMHLRHLLYSLQLLRMKLFCGCT